MKRDVDLKEISDGRLYSSGDMVKVDCHDCAGCSACCKGMGSSIVLDPMDIWRLQRGINRPFASLIEKEVELGIVDGLVLPNIKMDAKTGGCGFLDQNGRCSVHEFRPGICRLFPLGRYYEEKEFRYFIQIHECAQKDRGKIKIKKWLGLGNLKAYETYIWKWHSFLKDCENAILSLDDKSVHILTLFVLRTFFETPFLAKEEAEFYEEFQTRLSDVYKTLEGL